MHEGMEFTLVTEIFNFFSLFWLQNPVCRSQLKYISWCAEIFVTSI